MKYLAMSFRNSKTLNAVYKAIEEALQHFNAAHINSPLSPVRIDKYSGNSFDIPARVFQEIDQSRLVIADLTDEKQNVYCEVGYAKARGIPFFLTFYKEAEESPAGRNVSTTNTIHFDLKPYRYIEYDNPLELRDKLIKELEAFVERAI